MMKFSFLFLFYFLSLSSFYSQKQNEIKSKDTLKIIEYDALRPAKASFYSAVLPGLGQVYNKKYWKVPLVYGAIGTSLYFYRDSQKQYDVYRTEYKNRLEGIKNKDEFLAKQSESTLINAQKFYQRNRDLSALFMVAFYVLNIVDANIDAHLSQFNVGDKLSFNTNSSNSGNFTETNFGMRCVYSF
jgi:Family of unknown function (DUF5683)